MIFLPRLGLFYLEHNPAQPYPIASLPIKSDGSWVLCGSPRLGRLRLKADLTIFDDFGQLVLAARTLKGTFVVAEFVWFDERQQHQTPAGRAFAILV